MPASYPGSVKTFTTKQDGTGNKIFAAHINDLQDEVTAIESGLTQGTAPLNSSNSTLADLNVIKTPPFARVYHSAVTPVANNDFTIITFDSQRAVSTSGMHTAGTSPVFVKSSGAFLVSGHVIWSTHSTVGSRILQLLVDSTVVIAQQETRANSALDNVRQSITTAYKFESTQFVEMRVYQATGSTGSVLPVPQASPELVVVKLR